MAVRARRDVTLAEIAKAVEISPASLSEYEADKKVPREGVLARLAAYLGVTPAYLRYGIAPATPQVDPDPTRDRKVTAKERANLEALAGAQPKRRRERGGDGG
jgi:transcriptional regulator with XRE-family HTH domain